MEWPPSTSVGCLRTPQGKWEERDMDPHMRSEPLIVVSLIGGFALIVAVCRIGDEQEPSCRVAPGDGWS
jgi:hypothetical protein